LGVRRKSESVRRGREELRASYMPISVKGQLEGVVKNVLGGRIARERSFNQVGEVAVGGGRGRNQQIEQQVEC